MEIKKSKFTTEKSGVLAIGMALLSLGVAILTTASQHITVTWQFALEIAFGTFMLTVGIICLKLREYLKLNRWEHADVVCDHSLMQRFLSRMEGE